MGYKRKCLYKFFLILLIFFLFINCFPSYCSQDYYADITIDVDSSGFVNIDGLTNHPDLLTIASQIYVTKKQSYWLLNITKNEIFSDYIYSLNLPKGSSINYVKTSGLIRIEESGGSLVIKGFGENESLEILVQYQIERIDSGFQAENNFIIIFLIIIVICLIVIILFFIYYRRKNTVSDEYILQNEDHFKGLNERQKQIMKLLMESKTPLTQANIQKELNIPKAAVSRNTHALEFKGLIEIEKIGMSNLIRIKKP